MLVSNCIFNIFEKLLSSGLSTPITSRLENATTEARQSSAAKLHHSCNSELIDKPCSRALNYPGEIALLILAGNKSPEQAKHV